MSETILALPLYVPIPKAIANTGASGKVIARLCKAGIVRSVRPDYFQRVDLIQLRQWLKKNAAEKTKRGHFRKHLTASHDPRAGAIYAILEPKGNKVRYIGKATDHKARWRGHLHDLRSGQHQNQWLQRWFDKLTREGREPKFKILQECLPGTMDACEGEWIARGRAKGWKLCNLSEGGEGHGHGEESRRKLSEKSKALWSSPTYRERWRTSMKAAGLLVSDEERERRRQLKRLRAARHAASAAKAKRRKARAEERKRWVFVPLTCRGAAFVHLTNGAYATVDADDWERVDQYKWALQIKGEYRRAKRSFVGGRIELLNRFIMNAKPEEMVRHRDGNQLNCRRGNLLVIVQMSGRKRAVA